MSYINLLDIIYPVGTVYSSYASVSPADLFGGTWVAITNRFPYYNAGTATGGSNTHILTIAQLPKNYAQFSYRPSQGSMSTIYEANIGCVLGNSWRTDVSPVVIQGDIGGQGRAITFTGSGQAHNNMPAYQTLYAWRRTA